MVPDDSENLQSELLGTLGVLRWPFSSLAWSARDHVPAMFGAGEPFAPRLGSFLDPSVFWNGALLLALWSGFWPERHVFGATCSSFLVMFHGNKSLFHSQKHTFYAKNDVRSTIPLLGLGRRQAMARRKKRRCFFAPSILFGKTFMKSRCVDASGKTSRDYPSSAEAAWAGNLHIRSTSWASRFSCLLSVSFLCNEIPRRGGLVAPKTG